MNLSTYEPYPDKGAEVNGQKTINSNSVFPAFPVFPANNTSPGDRAVLSGEDDPPLQVSNKNNSPTKHDLIFSFDMYQ